MRRAESENALMVWCTLGTRKEHVHETEQSGICLTSHLNTETHSPKEIIANHTQVVVFVVVIIKPSEPRQSSSSPHLLNVVVTCKQLVPPRHTLIRKGYHLRPSAFPLFPSPFAACCLAFAKRACSAASLSNALTCSLASLTAAFAANSARSASRSADSALITRSRADTMLASSEPVLWSREWRLCGDVWVWVWVPLRDGEEERRRLNIERELVVVGGGEVVLWLEKRPEERVCTGAGAGEGSRRDPKRGIVVVVAVLLWSRGARSGGPSGSIVEWDWFMEMAVKGFAFNVYICE